LHFNNQDMASLKERFNKWKETRSKWQKAGDLFFWLLLILLIIPGPRKVISTSVNKVILNVKNPRTEKEEDQQRLHDMDYNWTLAWSADEPFYFSELREEVIFLNFWATWCPPCVAELPEIQRAYEKYGDQIAFVLVSNQEPSVVEAFMDKHGYKLPVFYLGPKTPEIFSHRALPTTFIISRDGTIVLKKTGAANWDSKATYKIFEDLLK
jgi:thiol-disulfide isomerase/thioredoxin